MGNPTRATLTRSRADSPCPRDSPSPLVSLSLAGGSIGGTQVYAIMLTVINMGDAISLQITAPIVSALGITYDDFSALPSLIGISTATAIAVLLGLGLVWGVAELRG